MKVVIFEHEDMCAAARSEFVTNPELDPLKMADQAREMVKYADPHCSYTIATPLGEMWYEYGPGFDSAMEDDQVALAGLERENAKKVLGFLEDIDPDDPDEQESLYDATFWLESLIGDLEEKEYEAARFAFMMNILHHCDHALDDPSGLQPLGRDIAHHFEDEPEFDPDNVAPLDD